MTAFGLVKTGVFSPHPREHRADLIQSGGERLQLMGLGEEGISSGGFCSEPSLTSCLRFMCCWNIVRYPETNSYCLQEGFTYRTCLDLTIHHQL